MRHILQDVRFGVRTLLKTPGFTVVAVLVLALGIGANTAMFTVVNAMMFRPLAGKAGELVGLYSHDPSKPGSYRAFSYPNFEDIRANNDVFEAVMAHTFSMVGVPAGDTIRQTFVEVISSNYFTTLGVTLAAGREFTPDEERPGARIPVVIVRNERGDLLGKTVKVNSMDFTVVGVAPRGFTGTMALVSAEMWFPLGMFDVVVTDIFKGNGASIAERGNTPLVVAGRLKPGVTMAHAGAQLEVLSKSMAEAYPADNKGQLLTINPLPRMSTSTSPGSDDGLGVAAALLMALAGVVLLIACLNIANMLLARGAGRRKEMAIRLAVGGGRGRIIAQLLTEGLLLAGSGAAAGLLLAYWSTSALGRSLAAVMPMAIEFETGPDALVLFATTAFAVVATVVSGLGPALKMSRADLVSDLKDLAAAGEPSLGRRFTMRNVLVVGQIALSLMLLAAGGLFARGALKAAAANPGFSYERQFLVGIDPSLAQYDEVKGRELRRVALERIRRVPGVDAAGYANSVPFGEFHEGETVERVGGTDAQGVSATFRIISGDYFRTLNLPMVRGREFTQAEEESATAPRVAIVDERLARRLFGADDPLGQTIRFVHQEGVMRQQDTTPMEIVGIAAPIRDELFDREARPAIYVPSGRNYRSMTSIHVRATGTAAAVLDDIRRELRASDARLPVTQATTLQAFHDRSLELWAVRAGGRMFLILGLLALLLAVVGLYGVKSYLVSQRTREIGIRIALGARPAEVLRMVLRDGAVLAGVGVAVGLPLAILLGFGLSSLLYDVKPLDPVVFTLAPISLAAAALVATLIPARRATRVNPLEALRTN
jgi:putative ABC transport system permease protein